MTGKNMLILILAASFAAVIATVAAKYLDAGNLAAPIGGAAGGLVGALMATSMGKQRD